MMKADSFTRADDLVFARPPRIAVGLLWQETNSFNPLPTQRSDFSIHEGDAITEAYATSQTSLGGIIRRLRELRAETLPILAAKARPGGPLEKDLIEELIARMVSGIVSSAPDAVCLELHGSMGGQGIDDVEGELLRRLRAALGPSVPIAAALDLHGNMTPLMAASADFLTAYRTHPHADMPETGARAASVLAAIMQGRVAPVATMRSLPFLALFNDETSMPPLAGTRRLADVLLAGMPADFLDLSIFNVHPFHDLPDIGQVVLAYGDGVADAADALADKVADHLWAIRRDFLLDQPGLDVLFRSVAGNAARSGRPVALGDQGDSVLAGTPGDSVEIARYGRMNHADLRGFIPVYDPAIVERAHMAGAGGRFHATIGASVSSMLKPLDLDVEVERLTDGRFSNTGIYMEGLANDLGATAILRAGSQVFAVTSRAPAACDPGFVTHAGYRVSDFDYLVMKAGNHFKLCFEADCDCFTAPTDGLSGRTIDTLPHELSRPLFPLDEDAERDDTHLRSKF